MSDGGVTQVLMQTRLGDLVIEVYSRRAPKSAGDFLRYVDTGLYDGAAFYRTVTVDNDHGVPVIEVVQAGLLDSSRVLPPVGHESTEATGLKHLNGTVSLARTEPGTGSAASFFICVGPQPALDFGGRRNPDGLGFAAFGQVVQGMDVVGRIHRQGVRIDAPVEVLRGQLIAQPVAILSVQATRFTTQ